MPPLYIVLFATVAGLICAPFYPVPFAYGSVVVVVFLSLFWFLRHKRKTAALVFLFISLLVFSNIRYQLELPIRQDVVSSR